VFVLRTFSYSYQTAEKRRVFFPLNLVTYDRSMGKSSRVETVHLVDCVWNVMAHAQKPDFVFRRNGRVHLNRRGLQFSQATEVCASEVVMLDTPCSELVWRVLATHSIRQFSLHFPSRTSTVDKEMGGQNRNGFLLQVGAGDFRLLHYDETGPRT